MACVLQETTLLLPAVQHREAVVRDRGVLALGQYCLLDKDVATRYLMLFLQAVLTPDYICSTNTHTPQDTQAKESSETGSHTLSHTLGLALSRLRAGPERHGGHPAHGDEGAV